MTKGAYELIDKLYSDDSEESDQMKSSLRPLVAAFNTRQGVEEILVKELQYMHYGFGAGFSKTDTISFGQEIQTLIGEDPIHATTVIFTSDIDSLNSQLTFKSEMSLDKEDTRKAMLEGMQKFGIKDLEIDEYIESAQFDIIDKSEMVYDFKVGTPNRISAERVTIMNMLGSDAKRIDRTSIKRL